MAILHEGYYYTHSQKEARRHNAEGGYYQKVQIYGAGKGFEKRNPNEMAQWNGGGTPAQYYRWKAGEGA